MLSKTQIQIKFYKILLWCGFKVFAMLSVPIWGPVHRIDAFLGNLIHGFQGFLIKGKSDDKSFQTIRVVHTFHDIIYILWHRYSSHLEKKIIWYDIHCESCKFLKFPCGIVFLLPSYNSILILCDQLSNCWHRLCRTSIDFHQLYSWV